ncbi:auxin-responsive protein SAUR68-like [Pistacia vera]|uniref:auxin-responsive protein SAUR68-like n=1 Tax=Pistacia vera TaxID=55513 RepID=UPI00126367AD|nr:auxin-responsive protein SAUR68-like [Pistacia vera]
MYKLEESQNEDVKRTNLFHNYSKLSIHESPITVSGNRQHDKPKKFMIRLVRKSQSMEDVNAGNSNKSSVAEKGHFVVYTTDQKRFVFPLMYLNNDIFLELLKVSEEEFGLSSDGPITLPCDAVSWIN